MKFCVIIPVYNSENHIADVVESVLQYIDIVIVVDDGSTDGTCETIRHCGLDPQSHETGDCGLRRNDGVISLISYPQNRGKGFALMQGFQKAMQLGCTHAISMDADGQHLASDIPAMIEKAKENPDALIVGARKFDNPNMPSGNRFANRFSNFWFTFQTAQKLQDTQTGFRVYPLHKMGKIHLFTKRYEAELELLVRCAWRNIKLVAQPVDVFYPPVNERLSHFRKGRDFFRISVLNTVLCFLAVVYWYPKKLIIKTGDCGSSPQ
jgi:glycosyltransferase involved in cell wall biosynthesis